MKSRKQILQKMKLFYNEVRNKRKRKRMRLQVNNEFQQGKIKDLSDQNNVEMFTELYIFRSNFTSELYKPRKNLFSELYKLRGIILTE